MIFETVPEILFALFSLALLVVSSMVVFSSKPVNGVLALVFAFMIASILWMIMGAEFLSLALIFVYIGAVMTLFLYVVMMLNVSSIPGRRFFGVAVGFFVMFAATFGYVAREIPATQVASSAAKVVAGSMTGSMEAVSNTSWIGSHLYTDYALAFELVAVLLLVAMIGSIEVAFRGKRKGTRSQKRQIEAQRTINMVDLREKKS